MRNRSMQNLVLVIGTTLFTTGCILSQTVDRNYLGVNVPAAESDRKLTGLFLLPFATVVDILTLPVQAGAILTHGDNYPFSYKEKGVQTDDRTRMAPITP